MFNMTRAFLVFLLLYSSSIHQIYGSLKPIKENETSKEWTNLAQTIIISEFTQCQILMIDDGQTESEQLRGSLQKNYFNVIGFTLTQETILDLHVFKNELLRGYPETCLDVVVLYTPGMRNLLLDLGVAFWSGERKFLMIDVGKDSTTLEYKLLKDNIFRFCSELVFCKQSRPGIWNIYSEVLFKDTRRHDIELLKSWNVKEGFSNDRKIFPKDKMYDFKGFTFDIAALPYSPFVINNDTKTNGPGRYVGQEIRVVESVAEGLNCHYRYVSPQDKQWGKQLSKGNWTGMIGMVGREEVHWAICAVGFSLERLQYVDFSKIFLYDASELITPRALPLPMWQGPTRPFSGEVWIMTVFTLFFVPLFIYFLSKYSNKRDCYFVSYSRALLFCLPILTMRGGKGDTYKIPLRLFIAFWLLCAMNINIYYTSFLTSFLIIPGYSEPIKDFEELSEADIGWAKLDFGGWQITYFRDTTNPVLKKIGQGVDWRNTSLDDILEDVVKGTVATWENAITAKMKVTNQYSTDTGEPLVYFTGTSLMSLYVAWPVPKYAPYTHSIDRQMDRLIEAGLMEKFNEDTMFQEKFRVRKQKREEKEKNKTDEEETTDRANVILNNDHFQGPYLLLIIGIVISLIVFGVEIVSNRSSRRTKNGNRG